MPDWSGVVGGFSIGVGVMFGEGNGDGAVELSGTAWSVGTGASRSGIALELGSVRSGSKATFAQVKVVRVIINRLDNSLGIGCSPPVVLCSCSVLTC